ncbi:TetR family transcriptional regulator [Kocuria coralli]|uniref:TetR family transcriptional regulator n=1 Tax=Kocuria coralli TaxID=1461025 RepID=A0A5J5KVL3_9MICC|nr:TetR/AcrR family transcriptional regulator [Kocuria coralli]KAA9392895.1 TetR family transcriptional regulator [Kocuria coralli]
MGRWERTHEALRQAAFELFPEHGYSATGTAQIARCAGVSEMTLFRHFPTKEALVVADSFDPLMADAVRLRPAEEPAMRALAEGIRSAWAQVGDEEAQALRERLRIIVQTPVLRGAIERGSEDTAIALAGALVDRGVSETQARVATAAVIAGLSTALLDWVRTDQTALDAALGSALDVLGGE